VIFTSDFSAEPFYLEIKEPGVYQLPRNEEILIEKNISNYKARYQSLWYNIKELPVVIRTRQDGDRIKIKQGTKTVSDLLTDKKVSHLKRNRLLLLCDKDNSVMAILGLDKKKRKKEIVEFKKGGNNGTNE
ncbi:MAG TPA: tRNA lysidine(34) synthetase TilS, partial [Bacilli bacterium]|nr:tRNA lysidine(34) synthetase TilS [Bacilli bacterium]